MEPDERDLREMELIRALDTARAAYREAPPEQKDAARERYASALAEFTAYLQRSAGMDLG